jgi:phenylalanyl-tRNA synthetase alpha chain
VSPALDDLARAFAAALEKARLDPVAVEGVRVRFLGKKGELTALLKGLGNAPAEERRALGQAINACRDDFEARLEAATREAAAHAAVQALERERLDVTLPARVPWSGTLHPVTRTRRDLEEIFRALGFSVETGPEVEDDFHNFEALNLPADHPARDATDTFYLENGLLLRTHTSPVQVRTMIRERARLPIRMICPGRVYRRDLDATHLPMFHQLEGLVVGEGVSLADLKGTMVAVWSRFFGSHVAIRLRPGYFPFVEPGCEFDVSCRVCGGSGRLAEGSACRSCKASGWLELGGAGMVHPNVLAACGIDAEHNTGWAFGLGIDRIAMQRYGIDDLRLLIENDVRFLRQFGG